MTRFAKTFFWFLVLVLIAWQLPWAVNYLTVKPANTPFTLYSEVLGDFALIRHRDKEIEYLDRAGNRYSRREFDSLLPLFYARQLVADGRFPDSIAGRAVTLREVQNASFFFRSSPKEVNRPESGIRFLLESSSGRVDLEMPSDAFRLSDGGIEFIDMASNRIDTAKSRRFTQTMLRKGVRFPVGEVSGNPTARKEYDEGYVLLDADRRLFHLKMVQGRPYVRAIELPEGVRPRHLFITEFRGRQTLALLTDDAHRLYAVTMPGYAVRPGAVRPRAGVDDDHRDADALDGRRGERPHRTALRHRGRRPLGTRLDEPFGGGGPHAGTLVHLCGRPLCEAAPAVIGETD